MIVVCFTDMSLFSYEEIFYLFLAVEHSTFPYNSKLIGTVEKFCKAACNLSDILVKNNFENFLYN